MSEESIVCPVCGETTIPHSKWRDELSRESRTRALWAQPYHRYVKAWIYENYKGKEETLFKRLGVVEKVSFGVCGDQDIGLSLNIKLENGLGCGWTFYNFGDIAEFFNRAKANKLKDLVGTPVYSYGTVEAFGQVAGIDIIDDIVIKETNDS